MTETLSATLQAFRRAQIELKGAIVELQESENDPEEFSLENYEMLANHVDRFLCATKGLDNALDDLRNAYFQWLMDLPRPNIEKEAG